MSTLLIFEDNPADLYLMRYALDNIRSGCCVQVVDDGAAAIQVIRNLHQIPDVVVLDLHLPPADAIEVLREWRSRADLIHVPVVIHTSSASPSEVQQVQDLGFHVDPKPSTLDEFLTLARRILGGHRKTGQWGTAENRPTESGQDKVVITHWR